MTSMTQVLRPTVKRDISLFSVLGWEQGYLKYLKEDLDFRYNIFFHYDGEKVNFYHKLADFDLFKKQITPKLQEDDVLFESLDINFRKNVERFKNLALAPTFETLGEMSSLMGRIMSFYIFIVSDDFVEKRPAAWISRYLSEGILYEADKKIEDLAETILRARHWPLLLKHFLTLEEITTLQAGNDTIQKTGLLKRAQGYIVSDGEIIVGKNWEQFCQEHDLQMPPPKRVEGENELRGVSAYRGVVRGKVKIIKNLGDIKKVKKGDVLVAVMTNANYLPAMKVACGVVTDEGGITCHAAIAAREFRIPTITGVKYATTVLHDGNEVEVDAVNGLVKIIRT